MPQALQITRFGGPDVLKIVDVPSDPITPNGIRIGVTGVGVNFADVMMRMGMYPEAPKAPFIPGYEVAGTVMEVGSEVKGIREGDRVLGATKFGGYTSEIVLPDFQVRRTPSYMSDSEAATIPVNYMTAWVALHEMARVRKGDRVLVPSAAGGVGVAAVQLAALAGARVTGLVGSTNKAETVRQLGATKVLTNEQWETGSDTDLGGYDVILDATGGQSLKRAMRRLAKAGRVVSYGASTLVTGEKRNPFKIARGLLSTPIILPFKLMTENQGIFGLNMLQLFDPPKPGQSLSDTAMGRAFDGVMAAFEDKRLRAIVGKELPLAEGGSAHSFLQSRGSIGKVVLKP